MEIIKYWYWFCSFMTPYSRCKWEKSDCYKEVKQWETKLKVTDLWQNNRDASIIEYFSSGAMTDVHREQTKHSGWYRNSPITWNWKINEFENLSLIIYMKINYFEYEQHEQKLCMIKKTTYFLWPQKMQRTF